MFPTPQVVQTADSGRASEGVQQGRAPQETGAGPPRTGDDRVGQRGPERAERLVHDVHLHHPPVVEPRQRRQDARRLGGGAQRRRPLDPPVGQREVAERLAGVGGADVPAVDLDLELALRGPRLQLGAHQLQPARTSRLAPEGCSLGQQQRTIMMT